MHLEQIWPLFGLEITTPRLVLRPVRDSDLVDLAQAALDGIHAPEVMPFARPWTDAAPEDLPQNLAAYQWSLRGRVAPHDWTVAFAVQFDGRVIGSQDLAASNFTDRRTVRSGSWLTQSAQGQGLGTEMRAAILMFAFDTLGAEWAESGAASWNQASLTVSQKLGYVPNGRTRVVSRAGDPVDEQRVRLARNDFVRPDWSISVRGADAALAQLGVHGAPLKDDR